MRKLVVLVALTMVAVLAFEALDVTDADARKKKKRRPPAPPTYNIVACGSGGVCNGSPGADVMVGANGNEAMQGAAGNDIYVGSASDFDSYIDDSTSNDLYGGFVNGDFTDETIVDGGGIDMVDLSTSTSAYASTDFRFIKSDRDGDGAEDDLTIDEVNFVGDDTIFVTNHFGAGRIEYIKFSDKIVFGASVPLS